jgi:bifunctional DNA-binding transcriptional regulator/antitoxin component of YhaV-PrlF toxin-antitoxin module
MSDNTLLIGQRGEIYTDEALRQKLGIKKGGRVKATIVDGRLILEPLPSLEDLIRSPLVTISARRAEELSEEAQMEEEAIG